MLKFLENISDYFTEMREERPRLHFLLSVIFLPIWLPIGMLFLAITLIVDNWKILLMLLFMTIGATIGISITDNPILSLIYCLLGLGIPFAIGALLMGKD